MFPDSKKPTDKQRKGLLRMLHWAILEIRLLGWDNNAEQVADLADAFHNLPIYLESEDFSFEFFRQFLLSYQQKYPEREHWDYIKMLDKVIKEEDLD
jgi:hypothetical protein